MEEVTTPSPRYVRANGIELAYEAFGSQDGEAMLLVAGLGAQMVTWQPTFCAALARRGFHVVRYDSRDVGLSQKFPGSAYTTADMADDAAGLIARLGISPAHVVGQSLGGMVAQELAIRHPLRVRSLALFSSTPDLSHFTELAASVGGPLPAAEREEFISRYSESEAMFASPDYPADQEWLRKVGGLVYDRDWYPEGRDRHIHALLTAPALTASLGSVGVPALVVHGGSDPLIRPSGGEALAGAIPGAELRIVPGMGHTLPTPLLDELAGAAAANARRAQLPSIHVLHQASG